MSPKLFCSITCHNLLGRGYKLLSSTLVLEEISWLVGNQSLWILIAEPAEVITSNINNSVHLLVKFSVLLKVKWMPWGSYVFISPCFVFPFYFFSWNPPKNSNEISLSQHLSFFLKWPHTYAQSDENSLLLSPQTHCIWNYFNYSTCQRKQLT